jgi:hypothetical protein
MPKVQNWKFLTEVTVTEEEFKTKQKTPQITSASFY